MYASCAVHCRWTNLHFVAVWCACLATWNLTLGVLHCCRGGQLVPKWYACVYLAAPLRVFTIWLPRWLQEYCPSGHRCSNQMFTKREYAKLEVVRLCVLCCVLHCAWALSLCCVCGRTCHRVCIALPQLAAVCRRRGGWLRG